MSLLSGARLVSASAAVLTGLVAGLTAVPAQAQAAPPAARKAGPATPGSLTGYAFDTCAAPAQAVMDAWRVASPYSGVGVYLGGSNRLCDQPNLTPAWVQTQLQRGWHVFSLWVGPQASCSGYVDKMANDVVTAEAQGRAEAAKAVAAAQALGIGKGATLYYDLEDYDLAPTDCRQPALALVSGWTKQLHAQGYESGVYSNIAAAIASLDYADLAANGVYEMPDDIWFAWANNQADTEPDARVRDSSWADHQRVHQYAIDVPATYGGYTLTIDQNWADVGQGSVPPKAKPLCKGVDVDLRRYPNLKAGARGPAVEAAQCLLRKGRYTKAPITGKYDARTVAAVKKAQKKLDQKITGTLTRPTWTALLARGGQPVLKVGSAGADVSRLQRALTAAGRRTPVTGVFDQRKTVRAVTKLQKKAGLARTGVVTPEVWDALQGR